MKRTKTSLLKSALALLLCVSMLIGSTFAWFTDKVTSKGNIIQSGNLDIEMYWTDDLNSGNWYNVEDDAHNTIFSYGKWEPGYTDVKYIKLVNKGNLAMNYKLTLTPQGSVGKLAEVINVFFANKAVDVQSREDLSKLGAIGLLNNVLNGGATANGTLLAKDQYSPLHPSGEVIMTIAMNMITTAGNEYQEEDSGEFTITALATQAAFEKDSFGSDYDSNAEYPTIITGGTVTTQVNAVDGKVPAGGVTMTGNGISAFVPGGIEMAAGADALTLSVTPMEHTTTDITVVNNEILIPVDVHISGIAAGNTTPIVIDLGEVLPKYMNMGNYHLYHVENGANSTMTLVGNEADLTEHNRFTYDPLTGAVKVAMASFSEVALVADTTNPWMGKADYDWYNTDATEFNIANADQLYAFAKIVGGMAKDIKLDDFANKTVKLLSDINLNGGKATVDNKTKVFYPIGYYNNTTNKVYDRTDATVEGMKNVSSSVSSFSGTFDGNGHTISNFYQNTWEMFGDYNDGYSGTPNYYKDAMGLFGYVYGGTIKNLTVDNFSSDGEFTPTGVIAAYADGNSTFENIAITNCNPRVYNTGNGGIIGIAGDTSAANDDHITLKNITVDNSNKISALWGSYDVACGGLVGMYRGNVDGNGNATGDTISFENCHVAAQMDVYNDVCGNYQYYWYRYSGMIIGSIRHNKTVGNYVQPDMTGISATGCTVHFGEWNNYYYCEFVKNGHPSYSGPDDYKFSRVDKSELVIDANGKVTGCNHNHSDVENNRAVYLPFDQLFTGYGWGVKSQGLKELVGVKILDIELGDQEESEVKFETKFTGDFLYRVGNGNEFPVGALFEAKGNAQIVDSGVWVSMNKVDENANISGEFIPNTKDWTKGTIKFTGTGIVKITIQDYNFCKPTVLYVEVVDAVNATSAASAKSNNVVLLNDVSLYTIEVSNGYTLYGNGFKMTATSNIMYDTIGKGYVTLKNGTLDNVQVICPNFSFAIIYSNQIKDSNNPATPTDTSNDGRGNVYSAILSDGNNKIINSYVHGGRAAIFLRSGNLLVDNSTVSGGAAANIHAVAAQSLTLRNATLIQKPFKQSVQDDLDKTVMGFSGLFECGEDGNSTPLILEGTLVQDAWINEEYQEYTPSSASSVIEAALNKEDYLHDLDNDGIKESLNLGFTYIPQNLGGKTSADNVTDNRTNKTDIPYAVVDVNSVVADAKVYSYKNTNGTSDDFKNVDDYYKPTTQGVTAPTVSFTDANADREFETKFDTSDNRWESTLTINLDNGNYAFSFDKLLVQKYGKNLTYAVKTESGTEIDISKAISLTASGVTNYILTVTEEVTVRTGETTKIVHTIYFSIVATKTSIPDPEVADTAGGTVLLVVKSKDSDWSCAIPALEGIKIKYYTANGDVILDLATLTPTSTGKQNGTKNYWETTKDGYKLKVTCGYIHDTKQIYGMPVVVNNSGNKMYFTISSTNGYVSTSTAARSVTLTYEFTDPNGKTLTFSKSWNVNRSTMINSGSKQYSYSDFVNGTLKEASSSGCVTPDTLITLADGTQVRVDSLKGDEMLLVWNHETGKLDKAPVAYIVDHEGIISEREIIHLTFANGKTVKIIGEHVFFDATQNKYVSINSENADELIGHSFAALSTDGTTVEKVELIGVERTVEETLTYEVVSYKHLTCFTEGILSTSAFLDPLLNVFDVDVDTLAYSLEDVQKDIEAYGLYTYADFDGLISEEAFELYNAQYLKIAVGKGYITWNDILNLIDIYFNVDVKPIQ